MSRFSQWLCEATSRESLCRWCWSQAAEAALWRGDYCEYHFFQFFNRFLACVICGWSPFPAFGSSSQQSANTKGRDRSEIWGPPILKRWAIPKMGIGFWVRTKGDSKTVSLNKHQLNLREYALKVMAGLKYIVLTKLMSITTFTALKQGTFCICYLLGRTPKDHETTFQHIHLLTNCSLRQNKIICVHNPL